MVFFATPLRRNHMFCTDAMALSALMARCIGVRFIDPAAQHLLQPTRYRTLEGVAEICDAGILSGEGERLVQRIPIHQERR